ncbi:MAG TPA: NusA-like transcription termination signal-binding factor [Candidatus Nanoarchaeia archaeon]|nr:NusA-like transcription termination signal-binding factor [Candidatus Nanoarchaeia archaeon]
MAIKYDTQLIQTMALFERLTGAETRDCFQYPDRLVFVVNPGQMGKALGKHKMHPRKLEQMFKKKVQIVEYADTLKGFIRNLIQPLTVDDIEEGKEEVVLKVKDTKTKGYLIGIRAQNLKRLQETVQQYYPINKIKVV